MTSTKHLPADASDGDLATAIASLAEGESFTLADVQSNLQDWTVERTPQGWRCAGNSEASVCVTIADAMDWLRSPAPEPSTFIVEIERGASRAMQNGEDVALALREVADKIDTMPAKPWSGEGPILDSNGNTVGRWTFHDQN